MDKGVRGLAYRSDMSRMTLGLSDALSQYILDHSTKPDEVLRDLIDETTGTGRSSMQIGPDQGMFMTIITQLVGVQFAVEVGTFTGYSSICIARGLAPGGRLLCCDVSEEWTSIAQRYWKRAGVADRIELRLAPAVETLRTLPLEPHVDLAFIDADKGGYRTYWDEIVPRVRPGGVILVDNVLWSGRVADDDTHDEDVHAIRAFNDHAAADSRVELVVLPIADGLTVARRIGHP